MLTSSVNFQSQANKILKIQIIISSNYKANFYPTSQVILGNHFDAWVYGAVDPNSGTSILAEVGRAFAKTAKEQRWRPKRTIMFCAWLVENPR